MNYPKAPDKKVQKLSNILVRYAEKKGLEFSFAGDEVYLMETFAYFGTLSLFLVEAKEQYEKIYNKIYTVEELMASFGREIPALTEEQSKAERAYLDAQPITKKFPVVFESQEEGTYFGFIPRIPENKGADFNIIAHLTHYALDEYVKLFKKNEMLLVNGRIPLEPLYEKMAQKVNDRSVEILPPSITHPTPGMTLNEEIKN